MKNNILLKENGEPQCQYFVLRKKRLCRMTVRPGKQYCGEHAPQPVANDDQDTKRIPCPNDPKHTCYASKLEKHLTICNARQQEEPDYIIHNVNLGPGEEEYQHRPLTQVPPEILLRVIDQINSFYNEHLIHNIRDEVEKPIHSSVMEEFIEGGRSESSLRHLRQVSSLLHLAEGEQLVRPNTCYIDLGAGKGQLGVYACRAWTPGGGDAGGGVVLVERAALRHKRDRLAAPAPAAAAAAAPAALTRLRCDLAHVSLARVPAVRDAEHVVGLAKHLCGAATDLALRALCAAQEAGGRVAGAVLATCCHHRVHPAHYVATTALQEYGFGAEELDVVLGVVSWATCGDGRPRGAAGRAGAAAGRAETGRRAKALLDWGRVQFLRQRGFSARLVRFVAAHVTPENVCIVASREAPAR